MGQQSFDQRCQWNANTVISRGLHILVYNMGQSSYHRFLLASILCGDFWIYSFWFNGYSFSVYSVGGGLMGLIAWLAGALASILGISAVRFIAWKLVIYAIVTVVVPVIIMNIIYSIIENAMALASTAQNQYGVTGYILQLTGLAAWFAIHLKIVEGFALIMSAVLFRMALKIIPFVRL